MKMKKQGILVGFLILLSCLLAAPVLAAPEEEAQAYLDDSFRLVDGFTSHFPVVTIEADGQAGLFQENQSLTNALLGGRSQTQATYSEQWSEEARAGKPKRVKADYSLKLPDAAATQWGDALWGEPVLGDWYLLGSMYDKSLMRNYLALSLATEMGISSYRSHYCEVFVAVPGGYEYRGVYLLAAPLKEDYYQLQRGNYWDLDSTPLDTYALRREMVGDGLYVPSLYGHLDEGTRSRLEAGMDEAEAHIYSYDYNEFSQYEDYLDIDKVYDYFILYELFGNYDAGFLPLYAYDLTTDKFWPIVLADFEYAVDNEGERPLDLYEIDMVHAPYYAPLSKNIIFVDGLISRYTLLAKDLLRGDNLSVRIDSIVKLLGASQLRDWARWQEVYAGPDMYELAPAENPVDSTSPELNRNTYSYEQEINKLKFSLREHGNYMFNGLSELFQQDNMVGSDGHYVMNTGFLLVFLAVVIASVRIARAYARKYLP